jgi:glycosyltransferase involved in cell wall biosynthesis
MNRRHNLLYLAFNFPPFAGPGPRHNLSTVRQLFSANFLPTVITASEQRPPPLLLANKLASDEYLRSKIPKEITLIPCDWPFRYRHVLPFILSTLKFTPVPYSFNRGSKFIFNVARRQVEAQDYKLIYSVNGIGLEHQAALKLKQSTGLPWVAEFRDPWIHSLTEWQSIKDRSWQWWCRHQFNKVKQMQREIVNNADLIVVESPMHGELLINDFNLDAQKVVPLGVGYETDYLSEIKKGFIEFPTRPAIGLIGTVWYGYQHAIKNLIAALRALEREGYQFTLVSVGDPDSTFYRFAKEAKLTNFVPIRQVDYLSAVSIMNELDFGIVAICEKCFPTINSKLWEYLALDVSILGVVPKGGSMDAIIDAGKCGYVLPYDAESMLPTLKEVFNDYEQGKVRHAKVDFSQSYSRKTVVAQLVERIEKLL